MKANILLLDPDGDVGAALFEAAAEAHWAVQFARTVRDALDLLTEQRTEIDLALVDLDPGSHSMSVIEALGTADKMLPVIALTDLEECYMEPIVRRHGGLRCLSKPVSSEKLANEIEKVVAKKSTCPQCSCDRWGHLRDLEQRDLANGHPVRFAIE